MCSCNNKGGTAVAPKNYVHSYTDSSGAKKTKSYSSEMDARMAASRLGGTVKAA